MTVDYFISQHSLAATVNYTRTCLTTSTTKNSIQPLESAIAGTAWSVMAQFYKLLPRIPRQEHPALLLGMGYNFEFYDGMFALIAGYVQMSMDEGDYTPRYRAMQALLQPFCSEYGIEPSRPIMKSHRQLYAEFYRSVAGEPLPERYPQDKANPWLNVSRQWTERMAQTLACPQGSSLDRAKFNLGYHWAVEYLSIEEFRLMRQAWGKLGIKASYLDAHCKVEEEHARRASEAVLALASPDDATIARAIKTHENDLTGYYRNLSGLLK